MGMFSYINRFINNLLGNVSITKYDDTTIIELAQSIPNIISDDYRQQIRNIFDEIHKVYATANCKEFTIGIIGDFTVGKSSFVNAILGERIAPVSVNPSTAIITKIKYGRTPKAIIHYNNNRDVEMTYEEFMDFSAFNINDFKERDRTGEIQRFKDIESATVYVKSDFLKKNNLCLIDTLGLSAHDSDNKKTIASIKDAIALIYICFERGLSIKDVDFMSTYLNIDRGDLFFCINRIDLVKKSEREDLTKHVKFKLDSIMQNNGCENSFPIERIYQVSSLYQSFANGFTNHDDYCEGIDYQSRSGFLPLMNDICQYVKINVNDARKRTINKQLRNANAQIFALKDYRKNIVSTQIKNIRNNIETLNENLKSHENKIAYMRSLFDGLEQKIYSLFPGLFIKYSDKVNEHWNYTIKYHLSDKINFGFFDYLKLEKDLMALKLNLFKSMSDSRYATLVSLSPFVNLTIEYLGKTLYPIINDISYQITGIIEGFLNKHSLQDLLTKYNTDYIMPIMLESLIGSSNIKDAMFRATAEISVESTCIKNKTRIKKMFDAAKDEALKTMNEPFNSFVDNTLANIRKILNDIFQASVLSDMNSISILNKNKKEKELLISKLTQQWDEELSYYNKISKVIENSQLY